MSFNKTEQSLRDLGDLIGTLGDRGVLDRGQVEMVNSSLAKLRHAVRLRDSERVQKAIGDVARIIARVVWRND